MAEEVVPAQQPRIRTGQEIFAGLGLGLAVGLLVGMSNAPVTSLVVSSLVALIATFFGLSAQTVDGARVLRIAAFGIACPIAIVFGLAARAHAWFAPTIQQQTLAWTNAGFSPAEARSMVAFHELGFVPAGQKTVDPPKSVNGLFSSTLEQCSTLVASRFTSIDKRIESMQLAGGDWKTFADSLTDLDSGHKTAVVNAAYALACQ
jgi:hypothetical protein